jgi:hypothetical protein
LGPHIAFDQALTECNLRRSAVGSIAQQFGSLRGLADSIRRFCKPRIENIQFLSSHVKFMSVFLKR